MRVEFRWPDDLVARIDEARGDVPRSRWVQRTVEQALERALGDPVPHQPADGSGGKSLPVPPASVREPITVNLTEPGMVTVPIPPVPQLMRASDLVREPELSDDEDPFAEDEWPPREAREW
jgi:hypothetical protein